MAHISDSLKEQLDCDEKIIREKNEKLLINVNTVRELIKNVDWYNEHKGLSIVLHEGEIVSKHDSSFIAFNVGVKKAGTTNVYMIYIE